MALAFAPVFAQPAGYSFLATFEKNGLNVYISKPQKRKFKDGNTDEIYEYTLWDEQVLFSNKFVNCNKPAGIVYNIALSPNGDPYPINPYKFSPGTIGYAGWEYACVKR